MYESFDDYLEYLESIRGEISDEAFAFASDLNRHRLDSPHSLHDAWVTSISIREMRQNQRPFESKCALTIELLGQMHDRDIVLEYKDVQSYCFDGVKNPFNSADTFHGDIARHQLKLSDSGWLRHEILLASEATFVVESAEFTCTENLHG